MTCPFIHSKRSNASIKCHANCRFPGRMAISTHIPYAVLHCLFAHNFFGIAQKTVYYLSILIRKKKTKGWETGRGKQLNNCSARKDNGKKRGEKVRDGIGKSSRFWKKGRHTWSERYQISRNSGFFSDLLPSSWRKRSHISTMTSWEYTEPPLLSMRCVMNTPSAFSLWSTNLSRTFDAAISNNCFVLTWSSLESRCPPKLCINHQNSRPANSAFLRDSFPCAGFMLWHLSIRKRTSWCNCKWQPQSAEERPCQLKLYGHHQQQLVVRSVDMELTARVIIDETVDLEVRLDVGLARGTEQKFAGPVDEVQECDDADADEPEPEEHVDLQSTNLS